MPVFPLAALDLVREFLRVTIDAPDEPAARKLLSKATLAEDGFHMPPADPKPQYTIGDPFWEKDDLFIPVTLSDPAGNTMTMPLAPIQEDGAWKLDMPKMMEKLMGGAMAQMGQAMGEAMQGIGEAIGSALGNPSAPPAAALPPDDLAALQKQFTDMTRELDNRHDLELALDFDPATLFPEPDEKANHRLLQTFQNDVLRNFVYSLTEAHREIPLPGRVKSIRFEGDTKRNLFAEGARIIYRVNLKNSDGYFDTQSLGHLIAGVAAGMDESPPPSATENRPSFRPGDDAEKITRDYQEFVQPILTARISRLLNADIPTEIDWDSFTSADEAGALWTWGLNRICGALALLLSRGDVRSTLAQKIKSIRILPAVAAEMKRIEFYDDQLLLYIVPSAGESGAFFETDLADLLSAKLKLRTLPKIAELESYAQRWEKQLGEAYNSKDQTYDRPIKYSFDWDGFTCYEDESRNAFALTNLREHGIDAVYYALTGLFQSNPNFKQQLLKRIRWIYLEHVPTPEKKAITGEQTCIRLQLFLHQGYDGYLTIKELQRALPNIIASMPDIADDVPAPAATPDPEISELQNFAEREQQLARIRQQVEPALAKFTDALAAVIGGPRPFEIAWPSLEGSIPDIQKFFQTAVNAVAESLMLLSGDSWMANAFCAKVDRIIVEQADCEEGNQWILEKRILTRGMFIDEEVPLPTPQELFEELRELFNAPS